MSGFLSQTNSDDLPLARPHGRRTQRSFHYELPHSEHHVSKRSNADDPRLAREAGWDACEDEFRRQLMRG